VDTAGAEAQAAAARAEAARLAEVARAAEAARQAEVAAKAAASAASSAAAPPTAAPGKRFAPPPRAPGAIAMATAKTDLKASEEATHEQLQRLALGPQITPEQISAKFVPDMRPSQLPASRGSAPSPAVFINANALEAEKKERQAALPTPETQCPPEEATGEEIVRYLAPGFKCSALGSDGAW
jgi:hypothetical protein